MAKQLNALLRRTTSESLTKILDAAAPTPLKDFAAGLRRYITAIQAALDLPWTTSPVERAIRPVALGRKNWLFAGSHAGGERAAAIYSLIQTAKLNGLDPEAYLRHVIGCIADHQVNRVVELLPWNIDGSAAQATETVKQ